MDKVGGVILAAGRGERMGAPLNKAFLPLGDRPLLLHSIITFEASAVVDAYVVVAPPEEVAFCRVLLAPYCLQKLAAVVPAASRGRIRQRPECERCPRSLAWWSCMMLPGHCYLSGCWRGGKARRRAPGGGLVVAVPVKDTVKMVDSSRVVRDTPARDGLWIAQTPQIFRRDLLLRAYAEAERDGFSGTDDASLVERLGVPVEVYPGSYDNFKVTTPEDLRIAQVILGQGAGHSGRPAPAPAALMAGASSPATVPATPAPACGWGSATTCIPSTLVARYVLGGVEIPGSPGLAGHSDADAALHALMDACLGAAGLRDIGHHFPPGDPRWRDAPSLALLADVRSILAAAGYAVCQVDLVIAAEMPRLSPYIEAMQQRIAAVLGILPGNVGVKATTTEGLGFVGRREGIAAWAVATVRVV